MAKKPMKKQHKFKREEREFDQKVIDLARVTRVMAGGKRMRFRACVAIGDKKGKVGYAVAKGADVTIAINKAVNRAKKNLIYVQLIDETIAHRVDAKFKAGKVMIKPAPKGTGVKAGGAMRILLELAGIPNIVGKIIGSDNKVNIIKATHLALASLHQVKVPEKAKKTQSKVKPTEKKQINKKNQIKKKKS